MSLLLLQDEMTKTRAFVFKNWIMTKRNVFTLFEILFWPLVAFLSVGLLAEFAALQPEMKAFILIGVIARARSRSASSMSPMPCSTTCGARRSSMVLQRLWAFGTFFLAP
jgi:hypothetical protein